MFKVGQWIYGIEVIEDDFENAEVSGYLFMAECGDYVICCAEYSHLQGCFNEQLEEMYKESIQDCSADLNILKKEYVFGTENEANDYLVELREDND